MESLFILQAGDSGGEHAFRCKSSPGLADGQTGLWAFCYNRCRNQPQVYNIEELPIWPGASMHSVFHE